MFDDIDEACLQWLAPLGWPVVTEVPADRPPVFVRVMRTGNRRLSVAHRRIQFTIECWNEAGEAAAERMADQVEARLCQWPAVPSGAQGWLSGPYPQRDPDTGCPRYVMTCYAVQRVVVA